MVCGTVSGTAAKKANVTIDDLELSNILIDNLNSSTGSGGIMPLLINKVSSFSNLNTKTVSTSDYSDDANAAQALIGVVGSSTAQQMSLAFSDMRLDGRAATNNVDATSQSSFKTAYGTTKSIFTRATLIHTLQYDASNSGSSAIYNYNYNEDWNDETPVHHVTYGKEISKSAEFPYPFDEEVLVTDPNDYQVWYLDMHADCLFPKLFFSAIIYFHIFTTFHSD